MTKHELGDRVSAKQQKKFNIPGYATLGQVAILVGMMLGTFFLLFAFVVNVSILVHAKINLQNAADVAAYAGASAQARYLNTIGFLNYEMRRAFKKFLLKVYLIGNLAYDSFQPIAGEGMMDYIPYLNEADQQLYRPVTCILYGQNNNYCRINVAQGISIVKAVDPFDAVQQSLQEQMKQFELIRQNNCMVQGFFNKIVHTLWLYNTDPSLSAFTGGSSGSIQNATQQQIINMTKAYISELGLVPSEVMLQLRIRSLEKILNQSAQEVTWSSVSAQTSSGDPGLERTVLAFLSAYYSLGGAIFNPDTVVLTELAPQSGKFVALEPIYTNFDTFAMVYEVNDSVNIANVSTNSSDCIAKMAPFKVKDLPVGFYKNRSVLTYYAIRLSAQAHLLFWPFRDQPTLQAYSAARPFGGSIGPKLTQAQFQSDFSGTASGYQLTGSGAASAFLPNLPIRAGEEAKVNLAAGTLMRSQGWNTKDYLRTLKGVLENQVGSSLVAAISAGASNVSWSNIYAIATAPNPAEAAQYLVPYSENFLNFGTATAPARVFAPLSYGSSTADLTEQIKAAIKGVFVDNTSIAGGVGFPPAGSGASPTIESFVNEVLSGLMLYMDKVRSGQTTYENDTQYVINVFPDPYRDATWMPLKDSSQFFASKEVFYGTSTFPQSVWNTSDKDFSSVPRVGYSVKFVSFDSLLNGKPMIVNPIKGDVKFDSEDKIYLKH